MTNDSSRVVRFHQTGNASVLKIESVPVEIPKENELRIKVEAIGLNRAEVMFRNGAYLESPEFPAKLGYEASGVVSAIGPGVTEFDIGDKVSTIPAFSMNQYGVYGEQVVVPAHAVAKTPEGFDAIQSTSIWMQYLTAFGALFEVGKLQKEQRVLISAASSSVGVAAIQLAKSIGAEVIATTRGKTKTQFLLQQGADHVIQTDIVDLVSQVKSVTDEEGVNLIFDPIGGPILEQFADVAAAGATIIEYGALDQAATPFPLFSALAKGLTIRGYTLFELTQDQQQLKRAKHSLLTLFEKGELKPAIDRIFDFEQIQQAHEYMESNQQMGKIVVTV